MARRAIVAFAFVLLTFLLTSPVLAQSRSVFWERWDVVIDNMDTTTNRFDVAEIYVVNFTGTFRFGTAVIPLERIEGIRNFRVYENDQPMRETCTEQPGTFCAQYQEDEVSVRYEFFQPITNGSSEFRLEYTVIGALRVYQGGDQLWWTAIPAEHFGFPILSSQITVQLPPGYAPREGIDPIATYGTRSEIGVNGWRWIF